MILPITDQTPDFFRMERSVMSRNNMANLYAAAGDRIAESIIQFICYEHQYNVFGYGMLDPEEFGKRFEYSRQYLFGKHANPFQRHLNAITAENERKNVRSRQKEEYGNNEIICENRIENAFFLLANFPLYVYSTSVASGPNNDRYLVRNYMSLRILKQFSILQNQKTGKIKYVYKLDDDFQRNLSTYYLNMKVNSLVALRPSGFGSLYSFLVTFRDALFAEGKTSCTLDDAPDFDKLCKLANIDTNKENRFQKRDLNRAFDIIKRETELDFTVEWTGKKNNKQKYAPIFNFILPNGVHLYDSKGHASRLIRGEERARVAAIEFKHELFRACPIGDRFTQQAEDRFFEWIKDGKPETLENIRMALANTCVNISSYIPSNMDERIKFFHEQANSNPKEDFDKWIVKLFDGKFALKSREVVFEETIKGKKKKPVSTQLHD